jgi:ligand-binding sensor domain-containing protein
MHFFIFLTIVLLGTACNGPVKKDSPKEKDYPKFIKTISDPKFGDIRCIFQDKDDNIWFGTRENGLYKYDGKSFHQFTVNDGLDCNNIYCILEDKEGKIWIGTEAGLCLYNGQTFAQIKIPLPKNLPPNKNPYYQNHWVYSMLQAKNGKLWFVTIDGVYIYDGKSFTHFPINEATNGFLTSNDKVERILEDNTGTIWLGGRTNEGVFRYDGKSITHFKLQQLIQGENGPRPKLHNWGWPQLQDKNGNIWFSNWGGAYCYDGKTFTGFSAKDGLTVTMVAKIIEDKKGNFWLNGDELFRYDGNSFTRFTTKDRQAYLGGWSILEDRSGILWVGTKENGLYIFDGKEFIAYSDYRQ